MSDRIIMVSRIKRRFSKLILITLIFFACILVNALTGALDTLFPMKVDLTREKLFRLSNETKLFYRELEEDIAIIAFGTEDSFDIYVKKTLENIDRLSSKVTIRFIDPVLNPHLAGEYQRDGSVIENRSIVISNNQQYRIFNARDCYVFDKKGNLVGFNAEGRIMAETIRVLSNKTPTAVFTAGHNESETEGFKKLLEDYNLAVDYINLSLSDMDDNASLLVIAGPSRDFSLVELGKINEFSKNGGKVMIFLDPTSSELPNLEKYIGSWGLRLEKDVLADTKFFYAGSLLNVLAMPEKNEYTAELAGRDQILVTPLARSITRRISDSATEGIDIKILAKTSASSYANDQYGEADIQYDKHDKRGPFSVAVMASKKAGGLQKMDSALFLSGSVMMLKEDLLTGQSFLNDQFLLAMVRRLTGGENAVMVKTKFFNNAYLALPGQTAIILTYFITYVIPGFFILLGIWVWFRRKSR